MKRKRQAGSGAGLKGPCTEGTGPGAYGNVVGRGAWGVVWSLFPFFSEVFMQPEIFYDLVVKNQQMTQEILCFVAGLVLALIVAVAWRW